MSDPIKVIASEMDFDSESDHIFTVYDLDNDDVMRMKNMLIECNNNYKVTKIVKNEDIYNIYLNTKNTGRTLPVMLEIFGDNLII